jgi:hypothetical protein
MTKHPTPPDPTQLELFAIETPGTAPAKPRRTRIKAVVRSRLSDWFGRKDLLPDREGRMFDGERDDA